MNYSSVPVLKDVYTGRRYYQNVKYPVIPLSEFDIYIETVFGDRLDVIADDYYSDASEYWIIAAANGLIGDSLFVAPGTQLRIPTEVQSVREAFNKLNNIL
jgi:hypothetical protein